MTRPMHECSVTRRKLTAQHADNTRCFRVGVKDGLRIAEKLTEKSAGLQSLDEPWADTTSPSGRMVMTIFAGIAEFERTLILSRTTDGRIAAKARGVAFGRPKKLRPDQRELARELVREGKSISAVARIFNVHPATIYRVIEG